jgi:hypothetical protein
MYTRRNWPTLRGDRPNDWVCTSEASVNFYESTPWNIPKYSYLHICLMERKEDELRASVKSHRLRLLSFHFSLADSTSQFDPLPHLRQSCPVLIQAAVLTNSVQSFVTCTRSIHCFLLFSFFPRFFFRFFPSFFFLLLFGHTFHSFVLYLYLFF